MFAGVDANGDKKLQPAEINGSSYSCNNVKLISGKNTLISTYNASGAQCAFGGYVIQMGQDDNYNDFLDGSEIDSTKVICNGSDGFNSLVKTTPDNGVGCGNLGGIKFESGLDKNRNNVLDFGEVTQTGYICNGLTGPQGQPGLTSLVKQTADPSICSVYGGVQIDSGLDSNKDGTLQSSEVDYTSYLCNPYDGLNSLIKPVEIYPGLTCPEGGVKYYSGLDANLNGTLESNEYEYESVICFPGASWIVDIDEDNGFACEWGGLIVYSGPDYDQDGILDNSEIVETNYMCSPAPVTP